MTRHVGKVAFAGAIALAIAVLTSQAAAQTVVNYKVKCKGQWAVTLQWTEDGVPIPPVDPALACDPGVPINVDIAMPPNANDVEVWATLIDPQNILSAECHFDKNFAVTQLGKLKGDCKVQGGPELSSGAKLKLFLKQLPP